MVPGYFNKKIDLLCFQNYNIYYYLTFSPSNQKLRTSLLLNEMTLSKEHTKILYGS